MGLNPPWDLTNIFFWFLYVLLYNKWYQLLSATLQSIPINGDNAVLCEAVDLDISSDMSFTNIH